MSFTYNFVFWIFISYGVGAVLTSVLITTLKIDWFDNRNYISDKTTKMIGVLAFGWLVKNTFMGWFNKKIKLKSSAEVEDILKVRKEMLYAEAGHLIGFIFLLGLNVWYIYTGVEWDYILFFFCINIVFNLYLVFLQQYNKRRIDKLLIRLKRTN